MFVQIQDKLISFGEGFGPFMRAVFAWYIGIYN
jgi:hypothetical protein